MPEETLENFYKRVYSQKSTENDVEYKERIFTKRSGETDNEFLERIDLLKKIITENFVWECKDDEDLVQVIEYYHLLHKQKEGEETDIYYDRLLELLPEESERDYIKRIDCIKQAYPDLPLWFENNFLSFTKSYYLAKFTKQSHETDDEYNQRLLGQDKGESDDNYAKRMHIIASLFPNLDIWVNEDFIILTRKYYETLYRQKLGESKDKYYNRLMYQGLDESPEEYVKRMSFIQAVFPNLDVWSNKKYLIYTAKYYKFLYKQLPDEDIFAYYSRLINRKTGEPDDAYVKRLDIIQKLFPQLKVIFNNPDYLNYTRDYYEVLYSQKENEKYNKYLHRVFRQGAKEGNVEFVNKMKILNAMYPDLPVWHNPKEVRYTRRYYMDMYKRNKGESEDEYYMRLTYQGHDESPDHYVKRLEVIQTVYPKLSLWVDSNYLMYTGKYLKFLYEHLEGEDEGAFQRRIFARKPRELNDDYVKRIGLLRKLFHDEIDYIFDNPDFVNLTRDYYTISYGQKRGETVDEYIARTFEHEDDESDLEYVNRLKLVRSLFPDLDVWNSKEMFKSTRHFYELFYEKDFDHTDDEYYRNIFEQKLGETDDDYVDRIEIFQMTYPELPIWENPDYLVYTKKFYKLKFTKDKYVKDDDFYTPLFERKFLESSGQYLNRLTTFAQVDPKNPVWNDVSYLKYSKPYFQLLFAQKPDESLTAWANRLLSQYPQEDVESYMNRMKIVQEVVSNEVWDKIQEIKNSEKDKISNTGIQYIDDEVS